MQTIRVSLAERSYDIRLGQGALSEAGGFLSQRKSVSRAIVITDPNVETPHGIAVGESLAEAGVAVDLMVVEAGEASKSVEMADQLWRRVLEAGADRRTAIVAVGGGVIGDLAGFIAATFARGLHFMQVPTTLLAQVDSSVGGKVGINLPGAKNMVGAFLQPLGVLIDTDVLSTLPDREFRSGLAEVVKYGVILDEAFFVWLEANSDAILARKPAALAHIVARSCELKAQVVSQDEREETGLRAMLNYGHTFAHAFETLTGYGELLHGEAVSMGMTCAARLAARRKLFANELVERQTALLTRFGLPVEPPAVDSDAAIGVMRHDKKSDRGNLRFILPSRLGAVSLVEGIETSDVLAALKPVEAGK